MSVYMIVPARGGSKGIPRKNLLRVGGTPLVARAVRAGLEATKVDRVFVSTDDSEIAQTARAAGAEIIARPLTIAGDESTSEDALLHALECIEESEGLLPDVVVMVQCTSPLTTGVEIDGTVAVLDLEGADCSFTGSRSHAFLWRRSESGATGVNHDPGHRPRRQDQIPEFADTGAVYAMRTQGLRDTRHRFFGRIAIFEVPRAHELEIDTAEDVGIAEALLQQQERHRRLGELPAHVDALVLDFDGVLTDNHVMTTSDGTEAVRSNRSDGLGIELLRRAGLPMIVLSKEQHPVVAARCAKLGLDVVQGLDDKVSVLSSWIAEQSFDPRQVVYLGNDVNDLECLRHVGCGVAVADAHPKVIAEADLVLSQPGGDGAVRELAELILERSIGAKQ